MKILLYALMGFLLFGCSDDASTKNKIVEQKTQAKAVVKQKVESAKKEITEAVEQTKDTAEEAASEVKDTVEEATSEVKQTAQEVTSEVKETVKEVANEVKQEIAVATKDASALYKTCAACHGVDASKAALGKSAVIKGWSAQKIADSLNGYKDGSYGGAMKAIMVGQVAKLSSQDIEALAEHISKF